MRAEPLFFCFSLFFFLVAAFVRAEFFFPYAFSRVLLFVFEVLSLNTFFFLLKNELGEYFYCYPSASHTGKGVQKAKGYLLFPRKHPKGYLLFPKGYLLFPKGYHFVL